MVETGSIKNRAAIRILQVDDDEAILEVSKLMLQDLDSSLEIEQACGVDDAFRKLASCNCDVVVSDYDMPQKDGLEFLKELREAKNEIPFILFTGKGREEVAIRALNLGADGYYNKQGDPGTVYGELFHGICLLVDRNKTRLALKESEKRYRLLAENIRDVIWNMDFEGCFKYVSPSILQLNGFAPEEMLRKSIIDILTPDSARRVLEDFQRFRETGIISSEIYELEVVCKDGSTVWVEVIFTVVSDTEGNPGSIIGASRNITERKRNQDFLRKKEQELENILDSSPTIIFYKNLDGKFIQANNAFAQALKTTKNNLIGKTVFDIYSKDIAQAMANDDREVLDSKVSKLNIVEPYESPTGIRWLRTHKIPTFNEAGELTGLIGFSEDITELKKVEQVSVENYAKLRSLNEKLQVVGNLTIHDSGNKLMIVKANVHLLRKKIGNNLECAKYLDQIDSALAATDRIFEFSRLYERIGVEKPTKELVFECFNQAVALMPNLDDVTIINESQGLVVWADSLLKQLFYNFIDNSLKHGENVTQVRLHYARNGDKVKLFYEDNGVGIPKANKSKLFEVGFTTVKGSGGLGLYLVKKMMDVYGWTIAEEGEEGKGVKFVMSIPISAVPGFEKTNLDQK